MAEGGNATFTLTRTGSTSAELTVRVYSIEFFHPDGSGSLDNPTGQYHQVNFAAGSSTTTLTVTVDFDGVPESSDSLNALVSPEEGSPYRSGDPSQASVAITDVARVVTIAADQTTLTEGDTATFTLTRTGPTTKAVVVNISVTDPGSFLRGNHWRPDPVLPTEATFDSRLQHRDDFAVDEGRPARHTGQQPDRNRQLGDRVLDRQRLRLRQHHRDRQRRGADVASEHRQQRRGGGRRP